MIRKKGLEPTSLAIDCSKLHHFPLTCVMWLCPEEKSEDEMRTSFLKFMTITISPVCEAAWLLVDIHMGTGRGEGGKN